MIILCIILFLATLTDLARHKIPNVLSLGGVVIGFILQGWGAGFEGLISGLLGLMVGLCLFLPGYLLRAMGAGDVKLMACVGTFVGAKVCLVCAASTLIFGMILSLLYAVFWGKASKLLQRYWLIIKTFLLTFKWNYIPPDTDDAGAMRFPYAMAILTGSLFGLWYMDITLFTLSL